MTELNIYLFGGFEARFGEGPALTFPTRKAQALIAYLAVTRGVTHSREKLVGLLWGETTEVLARHSLRQTLVELRRTLTREDGEPLLVTDLESVALDPERFEVDTVRFAKLAVATSADDLSRAAELYRGTFLEGFSLREEPFEEWCLTQRRRFSELALLAHSKLLTLQIEHNQKEEAIQTALRLLSIDPLQESVHLALMRLYLQIGRREAALRQYQHCASLLSTELGVVPGKETRDFYAVMQAGASTPVETETEDPPRSRILVVDDDPVTCTLLEGYLVGAGYNVELCRSGQEALKRIRRNGHHLLICDIRMPEMSGLDLVETLRAEQKAIPTIFLTALREEDLEAQGLALGAWDFLRKPIRKDILLMRVRNVLQRGADRR
ncbi:MAG TPA: response regulator [Thermoanaerobaculia bacterium]|nr:response regulator [Thermoanaerobaculia bacterium]